VGGQTRRLDRVALGEQPEQRQLNTLAAPVLAGGAAGELCGDVGCVDRRG
jgi:hypothetical protein